MPVGQEVIATMRLPPAPDAAVAADVLAGAVVAASWLTAAAGSSSTAPRLRCNSCASPKRAVSALASPTIRTCAAPLVSSVGSAPSTPWSLRISIVTLRPTAVAARRSASAARTASVLRSPAAMTTMEEDMAKLLLYCGRR
ncbi:hypothetical protein LYZ82_14105 [Xanthomonas hortorum pv. hederae]|nr:hypothetical protein [Xanthomonas hortorum pv. hederae]